MVTTVAFEVQLDASCHELDAVRAALAIKYGVPESYIELGTDDCARRQLAARRLASISLQITIAPPDSAAGSDIDMSTVAQAAAAMNETALSTALGVPVTITTPAETVVEEKSCPPGFWCTAGRSVKCAVATYQPLLSRDGAEACKPCPAFATTDGDAKSNVTECVCMETYFDSNSAVDPVNGPVCDPCPVGTDCASLGSTRRALKLKPGYWRPSERSIDVRQCPDNTDNATTGCAGGGDPDAQCRATLAGAFCRLCANETGRYYVKGAQGEPAHCAECGGEVGLTVGLIALAVAALGVLVWVVVSSYRRLSPITRTQIRERWSLYNLGTKLKIIIGFYMIATKVGSVYRVSLPPTVVDLFDNFSIAISFGFQFFSGTPLDCMGLAGFDKKLLFWFVSPLAIVVGIYLVALLTHRALDVRRAARATRRPLFLRAFHDALPLVVRLLFLAYPVVTTMAFEAFPVHDFAQDGVTYLVVDVRVDVPSAAYDTIFGYAWMAIGVYPVGVLLLNAALLFKARKSISGAAPHTPLSRAIAFLYKDFHVHVFWWELMEMLRRFLLVGLLGIVRTGSIEQLVAATLFCILYLMIQLQARPYVSVPDDFLALASSGALVVLFFSALVMKGSLLVKNEDIQVRSPRAVCAPSRALYAPSLPALERSPRTLAPSWLHNVPPPACMAGPPLDRDARHLLGARVGPERDHFRRGLLHAGRHGVQHCRQRLDGGPVEPRRLVRASRCQVKDKAGVARPLQRHAQSEAADHSDAVGRSARVVPMISHSFSACFFLPGGDAGSALYAASALTRPFCASGNSSHSGSRRE